MRHDLEVTDDESPFTIEDYERKENHTHTKELITGGTATTGFQALTEEQETQ